MSTTLDRLLSLQSNMAFVAPNLSQKALFPTSRRPLASDTLNRICWQIERRAGVPVFIDLPDDWLNDAELIADLARHVNFSGLRLAAEPGSALARSALSAAERWRWPLKLVHSLADTPHESIWAKLRQGDLIALPATPANIAALPASAKTRVLLEFDMAQPAAQIARQMRELEANGFRQFGLAGMPEKGMDEVGHVLSLRSQPQLK